MRSNCFSAFSLMAVCAGLLLGITSCNEGAPSDEGAQGLVEGEGNDWGVEPCRCYEEGLSDGEVELCRVGKRDPNFLNALKKCSENSARPISAIENAPVSGEYHFNRKTSMIHWTGKKVTGQHSGSINIRSGLFVFDSGRITGGEIVVEMATIQVTDLEGEDKSDLEGHLRGEDFFGVKEYPTATFAVSGSKLAAYGGVEVLGMLTIKGEQQLASATVNFTPGDAVVVTVKMSFDRTAFGIRYGSGSFFDDLGDRAINDQVDLKMLLVETFEARKGL